MSFEVEMKFPIDDAAAFVQRLEAAGGIRQNTVRQADTYFNHPSRDFGETDEAFRVRSTVEVGGQSEGEPGASVTGDRPKGEGGKRKAERAAPVRKRMPPPTWPGRTRSLTVAARSELSTLNSPPLTSCVTYKGPKLDAETKTRREIEIAIGQDDVDAERFEEMLRCLGFREVRTVRKTREYFTLTFEDRPFEVCVDRVEGLKEFVELETVADDAGLDAARECLQRLAARLGLGLANSERRSYLALLLAADESPDSPV